MKKGAKKKMTIDDLAIIVAKGFKKTVTKDDVETSIDNLAVIMAGSFSGLEERLTKKIDGLDNRLVGTDKRIDDYAETKVSKISFKELEGRVGVVEKKLEVKK